MTINTIRRTLADTSGGFDRCGCRARRFRFGYDSGVISGALLLFRNDFVLSPLLEGVVTTAVLAGAAVAAGFSARLADRFGAPQDDSGGRRPVFRFRV